ncbi:MAG: hypothetical protein J5928_00335 [Firmicutes bacterium]|nr:hypothetical protein [Bacillota bacterium]
MRPISINSVDRERGTMTILYNVKGRGTELMSKLKEGDSAKVLGPLGQPFSVIEGAKRVALIGRGIGIAPLLLLAQDYVAQGTELYVYLSAKKEDYLFNKDSFEALGATVRTTTDANVNITDEFKKDCATFAASNAAGAVGTESTADDGTESIADDGAESAADGDVEGVVAKPPFDAAYSCGSNRLARDMQEMHKKYGFPAYISLEEHMACGVGACKGCVVSAKNTATGESYYARVCKDGPVFNVDEVI